MWGTRLRTEYLLPMMPIRGLRTEVFGRPNSARTSRPVRSPAPPARMAPCQPRGLRCSMARCGSRATRAGQAVLHGDAVEFPPDLWHLVKCFSIFCLKVWGGGFHREWMDVSTLLCSTIIICFAGRVRETCRQSSPGQVADNRLRTPPRIEGELLQVESSWFKIVQKQDRRTRLLSGTDCIGFSVVHATVIIGLTRQKYEAFTGVHPHFFPSNIMKGKHLRMCNMSSSRCRTHHTIC